MKDSRFTERTDAALDVLNAFLIDAGPRLSPAQHSQIMQRVEAAILAELEEERGLLAIWVRSDLKLPALADVIQSGRWKLDLRRKSEGT